MFIHRAYHPETGKYLYWRADQEDLEGSTYSGSVPFGELEGPTLVKSGGGGGTGISSFPIFLGGIETAHEHPRHVGHDLSALDTYEPPVEVSDIIPDSEIASKYEITDVQYSELAAQTGTVTCLKPNSSATSGITDVAGLILDAGWTTTGKVVQSYGSNEYLFEKFSGPSDPELLIHGDLVLRMLVIHMGRSGSHVLGGMSDVDGDGTSATNMPYHVWFRNSQEILYRHQSGANVDHTAVWQCSLPAAYGLSLISFYRVDNGDGTCSLDLYLNGVRQTNVDTGETTGTASNGTVTVDLPDGGGSQAMKLNDDTYYLSSHMKIYHLLDQIPADPTATEEGLAEILLDPTH